jgi:hypothetical protein
MKVPQSHAYGAAHRPADEQNGSMKAQPILLVSGLLLLCCALPAIFAPQEFAQFLGRGGQPESPVVVQLLGAGLFALGFLDWFSRFSAIGGIHGRPVLMANLSFFFIAATTLGRHASSGGGGPVAWLLAGLGGLGKLHRLPGEWTEGRHELDGPRPWPRVAPRCSTRRGHASQATGHRARRAA